MSGTKAGGLKAAATNKKKYGEDFYKINGKKGGQNGHTVSIDSRQAVSLGEYTLFDDGEILSKDKQIMMPQKDAKGYLRIRLRYGKVDKYGGCTYKIHRLVAENFIPNPENKPQVNHINGDKTDNRVENLEWVSNRENTIHAINNGLQDNTSKTMNRLGGQIRTAVERGYVIKDIAEKNGISENTIRRRVYDFEPEPITTLKVGRVRAYFYYDKSRKKYRVEANDRIPEGKQFGTEEEAQEYVNQFYKCGGFAADRELARVAGAKGGRKSRRNGVKNGEGKTAKKTKKITPKTTPKVKKILENHELGLDYEPMKTEPYIPERVILPETKKRSLFSRIFRRSNA